MRTRLTVILLFAMQAALADSDTDRTIRAVKAEEQAAGIGPTGNFARADERVAAYYRCYYTGKLELPFSYDKLKLRKGTKDGCRLDEKKFDIFFYPMEAVASGHAPVTQALNLSPAERVATVVAHEDFHMQVRDLPDPIAEAATTLIGFLASAAVQTERLPGEAQLFLQKAAIINRSFESLDAIYQAQPKGRALEEKRKMFQALGQECAAIQPAPRTFNRCVSAANNAGLAFDYTYTRYYPLMYSVYEACNRDLRCTVRLIEGAPRRRREAEVARYFEAAGRSGIKPSVGSRGGPE